MLTFHCYEENLLFVNFKQIYSKDTDLCDISVFFLMHSPLFFPLLHPYFGCEFTACSALSYLVYWMDAATLQSLHYGLPLNESDMKRGCGALYCEDQLLVLCKESYLSDHIGFHDCQHGCE